MKQRRRQLGSTLKSLVYSLLVHIFVLVIAGVSFSWSIAQVKQEGQVIMARVITELPTPKEKVSKQQEKPAKFRKKKKAKKRFIKTPSKKYLKRKAAEKRSREDKVDLARRLQAETKEREQAARQRRIDGAVDEYIPLIRQKVQNNWIKPAGWKKGVICVVNVRLVPSGEVLAVRVVKSCGSTIFDRSVENAVFKASPLPVPGDKDIFEIKFRNLNLRFNPIG